MSEVLTIPLPHRLLAQAEAQAARLGLDRAKYVRRLIEKDVKKTAPRRKHKFASEDLIGSCTSVLDGQPATNARVREVMRQRLLEKLERNR